MTRRFSLAQQIEEVDRELDQRGKVYPNLIRRGKLSRAQADYHVDRMKAVRATLLWLQAHEAEIRAAAKRLTTLPPTDDVSREAVSKVVSED